MAGTKPTLQGVEASREQVALTLLELIARNEMRVLDSNESVQFENGLRGCDRAYILNTYAECLVAVRGERDLPK